MENVRRKFRGDILIVDDEINDAYSDIYQIRTYLEKKQFPTKVYEAFPDTDELNHHNIAFIICDWKFNDADERLNAESVIDFLNKITKDRLIPVFICSTIDKSLIKSYLSAENGCEKYKDNDASCIFVVNKDEIKNEKIFEVINNWIQNNPSIKTMKSWEKAIDCAKEKLFSDLYNESEFWPLVLYQSFQTDGDDPIEEMGQFLSRNLFSRVSGTYEFEELQPMTLSDIELRNILDGERTYYYRDETITDDTILYTGDIFECNEKRYINIKRQCDLVRNNKDIYLLMLESAGKTCSSPIQLSNNRDHLQILGKDYNLANKSVNSINKALNDAFGKTNVFHKGKFLEKNNEVIIPCVCHLEVCRIDLRSLSVISLDRLKSDFKRKGRLLEPYISIVIEKFVSYFSSKGTMRTPDALLTHKFIYKDTNEE